MSRHVVHHGDCIEVMAGMDAESVDAVVTDPPYGLSFMGKGWDSFKAGDIPMRRNPQMDSVNAGASRQGGRQRACADYQKRQARDMLAFQEAMSAVFTEAMRVAKPGAHLLAFGGTRTYHRLACAIEDAGWEIRDCVMWVYGSGFPKSHDVSKAIDKAAGAERPRVDGPRSGGMLAVNSHNAGHGYRPNDYGENGNSLISGDPITDAARQWQGWGTALKPSHEPVIVARKPLPEDAERATIVENLSRLESQLCLLMSDAWLAEASLMSSRAVERLLAIAQWTAEDRTNTRAALCGQMDTSRFELAIRFSLNTVRSWRSIWEDGSVPTSTFITATGSSTTIGWQTLKSCVSGLTPPCIIQAASEHGGSWPDAVPAAAIFNAVSVSTNSIRTLSAHASAIEQGLTPRPDAIDQQRLHRPIIVARKPLCGTVAENVLRHGIGAINVDGCRIGTNGEKLSCSTADPYHGADGSQRTWNKTSTRGIEREQHTQGRWPANVIHDGSDEVVGLFPATTSGALNRANIKAANGIYGAAPKQRTGEYSPDSGSAARFFYCAKASKADRDQGCEGLGERARKNCTTGNDGQGDRRTIGRASSIEKEPLAMARNHHPTVKPTALMRYLCRLVTPPDGVVLDPFTGSGSTGKAAILEGFRFIGIEREAEYVEIARARIAAVAGERPLLEAIP